MKTPVNLVVVAHPDDEVLGFGGTGPGMVNSGELVHPVVLCGNVLSRVKRPSDEELRNDMLSANAALGFEKPILGDFPNIEMNNVPHVELVQFIEQIILDLNPQRIFTHHPNDLNDDHGCVAKACMVAARLFQRKQLMSKLRALYFMEIQSSTDWSFDGYGAEFKPNTFVEIGKDGLDLKIEALGKYRDVMRSYPHPRSIEAIGGLASYRGAQAGHQYAEAFQMIFRTEL